MNTSGSEIKILAGNSSKELAQKIADYIGVPLADCEVGTFSDGEISVNMNETVRGCDVFVVQSTNSPVNENLMELLIMIDALKRASAGRITAVIPYYGYARQDRKAKARDPITAKLVANLITEYIFELDEFIKLSGEIRNNLKFEEKTKDSLLKFINSKDFKFFYDKNKIINVLKLFYDDNIVNKISSLRKED